MVDVGDNRVINIDDVNIPGVIDGKGPIMSIINKELTNKIAEFNIPHVNIVPSKLNYNLHYHNPMYDFLLIADEGWMMYKDEHIEEYNGKLPVKGMHGYLSDNINMHAIFYTYGPRFKKGITIDTFELIHIYPMLCELLDIAPYTDIDGKLEVLKPILR